MYNVHVHVCIYIIYMYILYIYMYVLCATVGHVVMNIVSGKFVVHVQYT